MDRAPKVPPKAWVVTFAGTAVNLCLGILYGWSVWKANLVGNKDHPAGSPMSGLDAGWTYLTDAQATWAYAVCDVGFGQKGLNFHGQPDPPPRGTLSSPQTPYTVGLRAFGATRV